MKLNKKAITLTPNEIIELILVIAGAFLLLMVFLSLTNSGFDLNKETAKSYLTTFENEIKKADSGKIGEFEIWQPSRVARFVLVYFGDKASSEISFVGGTKETWRISFSPKNTVCICYYTIKEHFCKDCVNLGAEMKNIPQFIKQGQKVYIKKESGKYLVSSSSDFTEAINQEAQNLLNAELEKAQKLLNEIEQEKQRKLDTGEGIIFNYPTSYSNEFYFKYDTLWKFKIRAPSEPEIDKIEEDYWISANSQGVKEIESFEKYKEILDNYKDVILSLENKDYAAGKSVLQGSGATVYASSEVQKEI